MRYALRDQRCYRSKLYVVSFEDVIDIYRLNDEKTLSVVRQKEEDPTLRSRADILEDRPPLINLKQRCSSNNHSLLSIHT